MTPPDQSPADYRQAVLGKLRTECAVLTTHAANAGQVMDSFLRSLLAAGAETLYRFESTLDKLHDAVAAYGEQLAFLNGDPQAGARLIVGERAFNRARFAAYLVEKAQGTEQAGHSLDWAKALVRERRDACEQRIARMSWERRQVLDRVHALQAHLKRSAELGLIAREDRLRDDIAACFWFAFDEGMINKKKRSETSQRSKELLSSDRLAACFAKLLDRYCRAVGENLEIALQRTRHETLRQAARTRIESLEGQPRVVDEIEQTMQAIAGIRFNFACEQGLDCGRMDVAARTAYETWLSSVPHKVLLAAVRRILESGMDLELLRYVAPVREALQEISAPKRPASNPFPVG
ncbi:hypothetical protein Pla175_24600 [Pirellulimonas nuda]|uniref:Uncharacterized protein n=1 Tax=Pirellulimonas nuda TaxID=2528009 RepID=A0A518DC63_9BACT|nr:hypothetical protein [Pirellulimonas nuda]QDU89074.1 hypothetical protein Pla175_24600 [Pirellulimonas nuda]